MKKFILAALAATMVTTPVLAAPYHGNNDGHGRGRIEQNHRVVTKKVVVKHNNDRRAYAQNRHWQRGQRFDHYQARNYRVISNPRYYRLNDAPRGYRWVQSGNDAVLVGITSGIVAAVLASVIN